MGDNMEQLDLLGTTIQVESHSEPGVFYTVDPVAKTCSCPRFQKTKKPCKHMRGHVVTDTKPKNITPGRAMSGLIKSQRLRWEAEAVKYAVYLWRIPDQQYRLIRRVMIMSGEDNISLYCMRRTSDWRQNYKGINLINLCAQVMRLCRTPNWFADDGGQAYIEAFRRGSALKSSKKYAGMNQGEKYKALETAVRTGHLDNAVAAWEAIYASRVDCKLMADTIEALAIELNRPCALETIRIYRANIKDLSADGNYTGQALIRLFHDVGSPKLQAMEPKIGIDEVKPLIEAAFKFWDDPKADHSFPSYFSDGVHTDGEDERFAGTIRAMWGMCRAHTMYGRVHPDDKWPQSFWSYEQ